jgi:hypothetical protein
VKLKVIHDECGREVLVQQILESQGHCPWDGRPFNKDYTATLVEALGTAEDAGNRLENALEEIAGIHPAFLLVRESLLGRIEGELSRLNRDEAAAALNQSRQRQRASR